MAYRFTNTDKWSDAWFSALKPLEKLLFNYLCDQCDIAGFIELNIKQWSVSIGCDIKHIEGALKGLQRGLTIAKTGDCLYVNNFLKHQKNLPLNTDNKAHVGILKRFQLYCYKFDIKDVNLFIEGVSKGLQGPTGNGIGIGNGLSDEKPKIPQTKDFEARRKEFVAELDGYKDKYERGMLNEFYRYWSEKTTRGNKMKWEKQETWETGKRLATWESNQRKFKH